MICRTARALFVSSLLSEPLTVLLCFLPFILVKDLEASAWQVSLLVSLRPTMSLISFYWSSFLGERPHLLKINLIASGAISRLPFLFIFFFDNIGYLIFASAIHILFSRANIPAWMEVLKQNFEQKQRDRMFSLSSMLAYAEGVGIGLGVGFLLDLHSGYWRYLFFISSLVGLLGLLWQYRVPLRLCEPVKSIQKFSLTRPWKDTFSLMRTRPDFARFQWAFMCGGAGVMLIISVLPTFFADILNLSYTVFGTARAVCMGLGFIISSNLWGKALSRYRFSSLTGLVTLLFSLFGGCLLLAPYHVGWLYTAYLIYGIAQGGSHIIWHLSGPLFSGKEDSSFYSGINVVMVGVRGMIFPFLGSFFAIAFGPIPVIVLGFLFCLSGVLLGTLMQAGSKKLLNDSLDIRLKIGQEKIQG